jgi:Holliday junction resolvase
MTKINSRQKGASGEREVVHILREELGLEATRNLDQWRAGGHDILGLDGWAIEVKRAKTPRLQEWWEQTVRQAGTSKSPVLWYRLDRKYWRVIVPLHSITRDFGHNLELAWTAEITPEAFCALVREEISEREHGTADTEPGRPTQQIH